MSELHKTLSYSYTDIPSQQDILNIGGATKRNSYPTRDQWEKQNLKLQENEQVKFHADMAGKPLFRSRTWTVKDGHYPKLEPVLDSNGSPTHDQFNRPIYKSEVKDASGQPLLNKNGQPIKFYNEKLLEYIDLPAETATAYREKYNPEHPTVLFLTSLDEESIHESRYLILPFPNVLIQQSTQQDSKKLFQMPVILVESITPASPLEGVSVTGWLADKVDGVSCIPNQFKDALKGSRQTASSEEYQPFLEDLEREALSKKDISSGRCIACQGGIKQDPDHEDCDSRLKHKRVTVLYRLSKDRSHWSSIKFFFPRDNGDYSYILFRSMEIDEEEKASERRNRRPKSARAGAEPSFDFDFIQAAPKANSM